jgi:hypothetical protein
MGLYIRQNTPCLWTSLNWKSTQLLLLNKTISRMLWDSAQVVVERGRETSYGIVPQCMVVEICYHIYQAKTLVVKRNMVIVPNRKYSGSV